MHTYTHTPTYKHTYTPLQISVDKYIVMCWDSLYSGSVQHCVICVHKPIASTFEITGTW